MESHQLLALSMIPTILYMKLLDFFREVDSMFKKEKSTYHKAHTHLKQNAFLEQSPMTQTRARFVSFRNPIP